MVRADSRNGPAWLRAAALGLLGAYLAMSAWLLWRSAVLSVFSDEYDWAYSWYELQADHRWAGYLHEVMLGVTDYAQQRANWRWVELMPNFSSFDEMANQHIDGYVVFSNWP